MSEPPSRSRRGSLAGEIVAGHELVRVLAVGGMGEVYLARHLALGMMRAVKVIRADLRLRDNARERFGREAQVLARLQHNSIVQIIEFGALANGWPFLAMEYIDGPSLEQLVEPGPLPLASALVVLEQIADALSYAHSLGVIHRDLKPANILVRAGDVRQVKVIDFGLARLLDPDAIRLTADGQMIGSPAYMAPEQIDGERDDVTGAADVYALAGIAYMLLSGRPPFEGKLSIQLMASQVKATPPRISSRCEGIPELLDSLLFACLAKNPSQRPQADELASHLGRLARGTELARRGSTGAGTPSAEPASSSRLSVTALVLDSPPPGDRDGIALATRIMALIEEIAMYLSQSDPELTPLLRFEARIREQLVDVELELAAIDAQVQEYGRIAPRGLREQRESLVERARTLKVQQMPLQRRMVEVVERHRRFATGRIKSLFDAIDRLLAELDALQRQSQS